MTNAKRLESMLKNIRQFTERGIAVLPLSPKSKAPAIAGGVHNATTNEAKINRYFPKQPNSNYGVAIGKEFFVLDIDGASGKESLRKLTKKHGGLPKTVTVQTARGEHRYFSSGGRKIKNSTGRLGTGLDVKSDGGYVVGPGSVHPSGWRYAFKDERAIDEIGIAKAPGWLLDKITSGGQTGVATVEPIPKLVLERATSYIKAAFEQELARLRKAPKHQRNNCLNTCAFKIGQLIPYGILRVDECTAALSRTAKQTGLKDTEIAATIRSGLSGGQKYPRGLPFLKSATKNLKAPATSGERAATLTLELSKLGETDTDNALRFAKRCADRVIFTPGLGWLAYDGKRWQRDGALRCVELAKDTASKISKESQYMSDGPARVSRQKFAQASLSKGSLDRMIDLAKHLLLVEDSKLDADPLLLNTLNGTIDLRTGELESHDPRDLLTKLAPVAADPSAKCPRFKDFVKRVTNGDEELIRYLWACAGYSLTGSTTEQVFFFCYGKSGANGKSTFVNLIRDLMGDYACHTPTETLLTKQFDNNIPADQARLAGVRMVTAAEANFNKHLDEAKLKSMTGGEPITARFMRHDFFEFIPEFKLWLMANDMPRVRGTDTAFWRRVRVIPFAAKIAREEIDRNLPEKLRKEFPGILAWAVRGCRRWQRDGKLVEPTAVSQASGTWLRAADHVKRFVEENSGYGTRQPVEFIDPVLELQDVVQPKRGDPA